jgi:hypothetical protein
LADDIVRGNAKLADCVFVRLEELEGKPALQQGGDDA